jgi:hypothetical protein
MQETITTCHTIPVRRPRLQPQSSGLFGEFARLNDCRPGRDRHRTADQQHQSPRRQPDPITEVRSRPTDLTPGAATQVAPARPNRRRRIPATDRRSQAPILIRMTAAESTGLRARVDDSYVIIPTTCTTGQVLRDRDRMASPGSWAFRLTFASAGVACSGKKLPLGAVEGRLEMAMNQ